MKKIRGRIIRILNPRTVIINLGSEDGITTQSVFSILGEPEPVIDPFSEEELGRVLVIKSRVGADRVFDKFTIATTQWTEHKVTLSELFASSHDKLMKVSPIYRESVEEIDVGELRVNPNEIEPWKAESEESVRVGDVVEVNVREENANAKDEPSSDGDRQAESTSG